MHHTIGFSLSCPGLVQDHASTSDQPALKIPRVVLRPHTAPHVVAARERAESRKPPVKPTELSDLLIDDFSTGKASASKVLWPIKFLFFGLALQLFMFIHVNLIYDSFPELWIVCQ